MISGRGDIDPTQPAVAEALVLTTDPGAARLRGRMPAGASVESMGNEVSVPAAVQLVRGQGHRSILCEGGPSIIGQLLGSRLLDELFLTISPVLAGRPGDERRPGLVEGVRLLPDDGVWASLTSVRRHRSHLLLRYDLRSGGGGR